MHFAENNMNVQGSWRTMFAFFFILFGVPAAARLF